MRRTLLLIVAIGALLSTSAQPLLAAPPTNQPGEYVQYEGWGSVADDRTEVGVSVLIHNSRGILQLEVTRVTYALRGAGAPRLVREEFGTAYPDPSLMTIDDLSTVWLPPTPVEFWDCGERGCRSTGVDPVSALLTGIGPLASTTEHGAYGAEGCRYRYENTYRSRAAVADLVFDDQAFAGDGALEHDLYNTWLLSCDAG